MQTVTNQLNAKDFAELKRLMDLINEAAEPLLDKQQSHPNSRNTTQEQPAIAAQ